MPCGVKSLNFYSHHSRHSHFQSRLNRPTSDQAVDYFRRPSFVLMDLNRSIICKLTLPKEPLLALCSVLSYS